MQIIVALRIFVLTICLVVLPVHFAKIGKHGAHEEARHDAHRPIGLAALKERRVAAVVHDDRDLIDLGSQEGHDQDHKQRMHIVPEQKA